METFEIHITGSQCIHDIGGRYKHKTIAIDLLKPDRSVLRTEHMTSFVRKFSHYDQCKSYVDKIYRMYVLDGLTVHRVKIESPVYEHYIDSSLYIESHFESDQVDYPISRNQKKTVCLATDREYDIKRYDEFIEKHRDHDLELCLFDTNPREDYDWLELWVGD